MRATTPDGPLASSFPDRPGAGTGAPATQELARLLERAATLAPDDPVWRELSVEAGRVTGALATSGRLEPHLTVDVGDPPVVVARVLAVASRTSTGPLRCRAGWRRTGRPRWASTTTVGG